MSQTSYGSYAEYADGVIVRNSLGPAPDDILLGDFGSKVDED